MTENSTVLGPERRTDRTGTEPRMFSLMEVAQETGIAMPILLRYKREHPDRIPSAGSGAQQRFPEEAFSVFQEIHQAEVQTRDLPRRGGFGLLSLPRVRRSRKQPEKAPATPPSEPVRAREAEAAAPAAPPSSPERIAQRPEAPADPPAPEPTSTTSAATLTMKDIAQTLDIAYPTIARYVSKHLERIPHEGKGRQRRFPPEAVEVFRRIRKESKPGRPPKRKAKGSGARTDRTRTTSEVPAAPTATNGSSASTAAAPGTGGSDARLLQRIERLESRQKQLETMVRSLRDEVERPLTAIVEPA